MELREESTPNQGLGISSVVEDILGLDRVIKGDWQWEIPHCLNGGCNQTMVYSTNMEEMRKISNSITDHIQQSMVYSTNMEETIKKLIILQALIMR